MFSGSAYSLNFCQSWALKLLLVFALKVAPFKTAQQPCSTHYQVNCGTVFIDFQSFKRNLTSCLVNNARKRLDIT